MEPKITTGNTKYGATIIGFTAGLFEGANPNKSFATNFSFLDY